MIGKTLSHYKVLEKIGQGGMGEVYRAEDTNLSRDVAIKVLPEQFTKDPQRLARFEREAKLLASLNHPNIAAIYGLEEADGVRFLALELVPGDTLQERVAKGPVPVEEALEICRQIAEGVEAAHEKGVIHRDLKPASVKVTPEGKVKILDFGLAKTFEAETPVTDISQSPTLTEEMTRAGVILGTPAYMSPEQAKGKPVDKRADIFAFGAVLYELLTGKRTFDGKTITETLAKILEGEPNWAALPHTTPWRIQELLRRCLTKDVSERLDGIGNVRTEIKLALEEPSIVAPIGVSDAVQPEQQRWAMTVGLVVLALAVGGMATWFFIQPSSPEQSLSRFVIRPSPPVVLSSGGGNDLANSPDGRQLVYIGVGEGGSQLYLRSLDDFVDRPIPGTANGRAVFFSPDGESIGFFAEGKLKRTSLAGGSPITLCDAPQAPWGGDWFEDTIVFTATLESGQGLYRVSANGGESEMLATLNLDEGEQQYLLPDFLPDGKHILFSIRLDTGFQTALLSLETGERKVVLENARQARYLSTGHLIYEQAATGNLMAAPFDPVGVEIIGDSVVAVQGVRQTDQVDYAISDDGTLVYVPTGGAGLVNPQVPVWVDRSGQEGETIVQEPLENPRYPRLSPDGQRLTLTIGPFVQGDLWVYDLGGRPPFPLSLEGHNYNARWTPDGKRVAFASDREGPHNLFWMPADGSTLEPEPLLTSPFAQLARSWTPDGRELIFLQTDPENQNLLMALPIEGEREPRLVVETQYAIRRGDNGAGAELSPDGRWLAYMSAVTGGPEIWVRPYPGPGVPIRISPNGGREPVWNPKGQELFYLEANKMMAVKVATEPEFTFEPPQELFVANYIRNSRPSYDVGADGRFLMIKAAAKEAGGQINVILNWFEELKRLVPTN